MGVKMKRFCHSQVLGISLTCINVILFASEVKHVANLLLYFNFYILCIQEGRHS